MKQRKRWKYQIGAFIIPFLILTIFLFSKNSSFKGLLISDANAQYSYLFQYLKNVFNGSESLFYSFAKGMGGSMYATFFYYLSSPFNLLLIFVPDKFVIDFMCILMITKISLSGFTMYYYLKNKNNHDFINFILALSYSLMSYNIMYYFNVMWLDAVYLTPIVVLGVDKILENKKSICYIFFLFLTIISNYYIGYMVCIFLIIYVCYKISVNYSIKKDKKIILNIIKKFIISSILSALLASFMIFPVLSELKEVLRLPEIIETDNVLSRTVNLLFQFGIQKQSTKILYYVPYFFCGYFVFTALVNYFVAKNNDMDKKKVCILFIIFACFIILKPLEFIWHGFIQPIILNYRYAFLISFFLIIIVSEKYDDLRPMSMKKILGFCFCYIMMMMLLYIIMNEQFNIYVILLNAFFCVSNFLLINILLGNIRIQNKFALFLLFLLEIIVTLNFNFFTQYSFYKKNEGQIYSDSKISLNLKKSLNKVVKPGYRIGKNNAFAVDNNETFNTGYSRIDLFLSTVNGKLPKFLNQSGYIIGSSTIYGNPDQIIMNSLLGVRYWYGTNPPENFEKLNATELQASKEKIYENRDSYPIGYLIKKEENELDNTNAFVYQNSILRKIGETEVFKRLKLNKVENNKYEIQGIKSDSIFVQIGLDNTYSYYNGDIIFDEKRFPNNGFNKIKIDSKVKHHLLEIPNNLNIEQVYVYELDFEKWKQVVQNAKNQSVNFTKIEKNKLEFDVTVNSKHKDFLLTLPYEKGWNVFVDDKKVDYEEIFDTFITFKLSDGKHHIKMYYIPAKLQLGIIFSIFSFFFTLYYVNK